MDILIYAGLIALAASVLIPFIHLFNVSLSPSYVAIRGGLLLYPPDSTGDNYMKVFASRFIWKGYMNTLIRTGFGAPIQLFVTSLGAYAMSKRFFPHRTFYMFLIVFTMFFSGGLIPAYLLVRDLGLMNTYASMILPSLVSAFNLVIIRNYFQSLPDELEESCQLDGAGRLRTLFSIILPLSKPILATVGLWLAVGHWNSWFDVLLYVVDEEKFVLQIVLRRIIISGTQQFLEMTAAGSSFQEETMSSPEGLRAAAIFVATLPILCVYPFMQRYFVKGIILGSLKG